MTVVAVIQARMGSSRLPGKVLAEIAGRSMLEHVVERVVACDAIDQVVVATTELPEDDVLAARARELDVGVYRGSAHDVLDRYRGAAAAAGASVVVRVTADCPLLDPAVIRGVVVALDRGVDYASNTHARTFPRGLDVEAFHADTLVRLDRLATSAAAREHVTSFVLERPDLFVTRDVISSRDDSDLRLTVDTPADLALVRAVARRFGPAIAPYLDVVAYLREQPELRALNADVAQTSWREAEVGRASA